MMFETFDMKNPNVKIFIKYHIDDTTTISKSFMKKENSKKDENENFEKAKEKKIDE